MLFRWMIGTVCRMKYLGLHTFVGEMRTREQTLRWIIWLFLASSGCVAERDPCFSHRSCDACISSSPLCSWCQNENLNPGDRCGLHSSWISSSKCSNLTVVKSTVAIEKQPLSDDLQVSPQKISVQLRPGLPVEVEVSVQPAQNFPIDLYLLSDISYTMKDDLQNIKRLATEVVAGLQQRSDNVQLGFGSFVDKPILPYSTEKTLQRGYVKCGKSRCPLPNSFVNDLPLTDNVNSFVKTVENIDVSGNHDDPEGAFDAVMQVLVCKKEIGWREKAHRIVLITTDGMFQHVAGDGKIAGIVKPNDGKCHLSSAEPGGIYTESLTLDYPSIGVLNEKIRENEVLVVYATVEEAIPVHKSMNTVMNGVFIETLNNDSSNIVQLIHQTYDQIVSTIVPTVPQLDGLKVETTAHCNGEELQSNRMECQNVRIGEKVTFTFRLTGTDCDLINKLSKNPVEVNFLGFGTVYINVSSQCHCACSNHPSVNASVCNSGSLVCGQCQCLSGRFGKTCQCLEQDLTNSDGCRSEDSDHLCFGHGYCFCGQCLCEKEYEGTYCQCRKNGCVSDNLEQICGGSGRGTCRCYNTPPFQGCDCKEGFTGEACECSLSQQTCKKNPYDSIICSGNGECQCGQCICKEGYQGRTCDLCKGSDCFPTACRAQEACASCLAFVTDKDTTACAAFNCSRASIVDDLNDVTLSGEASSQIHCANRRDSCEYNYVVWDVDNGEQVTVQTNSNCSPSKSNVGSDDLTMLMVIAVASVIFALIMLLLVVWKAVTIYKDAAEYKKFVAEHSNAKFSQVDNPLYTQPTNRVENPTYNRADSTVGTY